MYRFHRFNRGKFLAVAFSIVITSTLSAGPGNYNQQGPKLVGSGGAPTRGNTNQGFSIALSADGNTALIGSPTDNLVDANGNVIDLLSGAAWVFVRSGGAWVQQGPQLTATKSVFFGWAVALSADGNTAAIGSSDDDFNTGAVYIFTRSGGTWTQQGGKLAGSGFVGGPRQGSSVALSADGNTLAEGGPLDNPDPCCPGGTDAAAGAVWVFTRSGGVWTQQGGKLVGSRVLGDPSQGYVVALSSDGNTLAESGPRNTGTDGSFWVFVRSQGVWAEQGTQMHVTGTGSGNAMSIAGDGNTILVNGFFFTRKNGQWSQNGAQVIGPNNSRPWVLSADASTAVGPTTDAVEVFVKQGGAWQAHQRVTGTGESPPPPPPDNATQGLPIALSANGNTMIEAGPFDYPRGATWVFTSPQLSTSLAHTGNFHHGQTGATYTITVSNVGDRDIHAAPTSAVNLVDNLPAGLTPTGLFGSGWNCTLATLSCTRADGLAVGASFPPVTVIVTVASNAPASVTNVATASGGGSNWGNAKDVTTIVP